MHCRPYFCNFRWNKWKVAFLKAKFEFEDVKHCVKFSDRKSNLKFCYYWFQLVVVLNYFQYSPDVGWLFSLFCGSLSLSPFLSVSLAESVYRQLTSRLSLVMYVLCAIHQVNSTCLLFQMTSSGRMGHHRI